MRLDGPERPQDKTAPNMAYSRFQCLGCGHVYDESLGNPREGIAPGTRWAQVPADFRCPDCAVRDKPDFREISPA